MDQIETIADIILAGGGKADEAMYYLLHERLDRQLRHRYEPYRRQLRDDYEDLVADFFLYLREGDYASLRRIRNKAALEGWLLSTFRNYLTNRAGSEHGNSLICKFDDQATRTTDESTKSQVHEFDEVAAAAQLIAYAHQTLPPRDRFILLRSLLTLLNKQQALPNDDMAAALGMTPVAYRVSLHRAKRHLARFRDRLSSPLSSRRGAGGEAILDPDHQSMAQHLSDHFDDLYPTLLHYYTLSLDALPTATDVRRLRENFCDTTGLLLHEPTAPYTFTPQAFWTRLSAFLIEGESASAPPAHTPSHGSSGIHKNNF